MYLRMLAVFFLGFCISSAANAATTKVFFKATGLGATIDNFGSDTEFELFDAVGIGIPSLVTGSFTFDDSLSPLTSEDLLGFPGFGVASTFAYTDFTVEVSGLSFSANDDSQNAIIVSDSSSSFITDDVRAVSLGDIDTGVTVDNGRSIFVNNFSVIVAASDANALLTSGEIPSISVLNQLAGNSGSFNFTLGLNADLTENFQLTDLEFSNTSFSAVPVPPALPLLAAALAGFGLLRLKRSKAA